MCAVSSETRGKPMSVMLMVRITSKPGKSKELAQLIQPVPKENEIDGCSGIDVFQSTSNQDEVVIIEHWNSIQRHQQFLSELQAAGSLDEMLELSDAVDRTYFSHATQ